MANPEHLKILKSGIKEWNIWREEYPSMKPDLKGSDLRGLQFANGNFQGVDLSNADLTKAFFAECNFDSFFLTGSGPGTTDLTDATFVDSSIFKCNFESVLFDRVDLTGARLVNSRFTWINFDQTIFRNVAFAYSSFSGCNFSTARFLDESFGGSPSNIDWGTIIRSSNLPINFLYACGVPELVIQNINVLRNDPISYYSFFISYSSRDEEFVMKIYSDLQNEGIRCWKASEDMKAGHKLFDQINQAIKLSDRLLLVLSEQSIQSNWVATEIKKARERERTEIKQVLFPISIVSYENIKKWQLFDSDEGRDLASEIRSYHIPDFSNWKDNENYQKAFKRLMKDIKG